MVVLLAQPHIIGLMDSNSFHYLGIASFVVMNVINKGVQWGDSRRGILEAALRGSDFDSY